MYTQLMMEIITIFPRVESSSGESDSSASSRESISSGGSDMIIIERTMSGMYKVLDAWIKDILPVLPHQSLQKYFHKNSMSYVC